MILRENNGFIYFMKDSRPGLYLFKGKKVTKIKKEYVENIVGFKLIANNLSLFPDSKEGKLVMKEYLKMAEKNPEKVNTWISINDKRIEYTIDKHRVLFEFGNPRTPSIIMENTSGLYFSISDFYDLDWRWLSPETKIQVLSHIKDDNTYELEVWYILIGLPPENKHPREISCSKITKRAKVYTKQLSSPMKRMIVPFQNLSFKIHVGEKPVAIQGPVTLFNNETFKTLKAILGAARTQEPIESPIIIPNYVVNRKGMKVFYKDSQNYWFTRNGKEYLRFNGVLYEVSGGTNHGESLKLVGITKKEVLHFNPQLQTGQKPLLMVEKNNDVELYGVVTPEGVFSLKTSKNRLNTKKPVSILENDVEIIAIHAIFPAAVNFNSAEIVSTDYLTVNIRFDEIILPVSYISTENTAKYWGLTQDRYALLSELPVSIALS